MPSGESWQLTFGPDDKKGVSQKVTYSEGKYDVLLRRTNVAIVSELKRALRSLSAVELESIADWLEVRVEESRYGTCHVREAQPDGASEEPFSMTWEEYLAFEERSPRYGWAATRSCTTPT